MYIIPENILTLKLKVYMENDAGKIWGIREDMM